MGAWIGSEGSPFHIGKSWDPFNFNGAIDEVRVSSTARSADWIQAQYLAMSSAFVTFGGEESVAGQSGVVANDSDAESELLNAYLIDGPSNASSFSFNSDGTFSYTPQAGFSGTDTFTYKVNDGFALGDSNIATVTLTITSANDISGTIYEDVDGDGDVLDDNVTVSGVTVDLYRDDGDGSPDAGDSLVATTSTDGSGNYTFTNFANDTYWVVVDSTDISPDAGFNFGTKDDVWAEQTYGSAGAVSFNGSYSYSGAAGAFFGGMQGNVSDDASALTSAEHVTRVIVSGSNVTGVNSGFSFNVVTNTSGGDLQSDDPNPNRWVQGSLRQFIVNANTISGANTMRFVPAVATNATDGGGNDWWRLSVTQELPQFTDPNATIDGTAYDATDGVTVLDTNAGTLGYTGPVGVGADGVAGTLDELTLSGVARPELEIVNDRATNIVARGFDLQADNITVRDLGITGFGNASILDDGNIRVGVAAAPAFRYTGIRIENNVIGSSADSFTDPGAADRSPIGNLNLHHTDGGTIQNNLIGFTGFFGMFVADSDNWTIQGNEIRGHGLVDAHYDGIDLGAGSTGAQVVSNLFAANQGAGVDSWEGLGGNTIEHNTFDQNGLGGLETSAIRLFGNGSTVRFNDIHDNQGAGVLVVANNVGAGQGTPAIQNRISKNRFSNNGSNAIDLLADAGDKDLGDGVTVNDLTTDPNAGNIGLDYPVIATAQKAAATTTITGTTGANFEVEIYRAVAGAGDSPGVDDYGEGIAYLGTAIANGAGNFTFNTTALSAGQFVSAIAIDGSNNTSEFGKNIVVVAAPLNTVPGAQAVNEDTVLSFTGANTISVTDEDGNLATTQLTVTNGTVTVTLSGAATISAGLNGSNTLTISGTETDINATLATLVYQGNLNFNGADTLTVVSTDSGSLSDTDPVAITVNAVNDAPVNTVPGAQAVNEDTTLAFTGVNTISVTDVDGNLASTQLTVLNGTVTVTLSGAATISAGLNGSNTLTVSGSETDINATLASLVYQGTLNYNGPDTLTVVSTDGAGVPLSDTDPVAITVNAVNDVPVNTVPGAQAVNEDTALAFTGVNTISVTDVDGNLATTQLTVLNGTVTVTLSGAATISAGLNGSNTLTLSGTETDINATLASLVYQGTLNYNGPDTLTVVSTDGAGVPLSDTDPVAITVNAVNDAPVNTVPGAQAVNEDTALAFTGVNTISVTDVDGNLATTQLTVLNGTVTVTLSGAATISAGLNGSNSLTLSGTETDINATLASLVYQGTLNYNGPDTLTVVSTDGAGVPLGDTDPVAITVNAVNDAPVNTVPGAQAVNEDTALAFTGVNTISVTDVDGNLASTQLTVLNGTVTVTLSGAATISAGLNGSNTLTLSGTETDINATLASLVYQGTLNYNGPDTLTVVSTDGAGVPLSDTDPVAITVNAVNDAPVNTVPGAQAVNEDTALAFTGVNTISVTDVDGNLASTQLTVLNGTVTVTLSGAATISAGLNGSNTLTISGTETDINATLASLVYQGTLNYNGPDTLTVVSTDGAGVPLSDTDPVAITVNAVNDAPVNTVPGAQAVNEDTALAFTGVNTLSVTDVDGNLASTQLTVLNGTVTVTLSGAATISAGLNGSNTLTISGTETDINATLATLVYQGTLNYNGPDTLTVVSADGAGVPLSDTDPVAITVNAVNDAPVNTVPGAQAVNEDTALAFTGVNTISVTDVDGNLVIAQLTVLNGTVTVTLSGAATISAGLNGSNTLTLSGTETDINATLASLVYQGTLNYNGPDTLTVVSTDGAGVPLGDTDPVAITVNAVNDAPVNTVPGAQAVNEDTALAFTGVNTISVTDVDGNLASTQLTVLNGTVTVTLSGAATISAGLNGSNTLTVSGSETDINATLASLVYQGTLNYNGPDTLTVVSTDGAGVPLSDTDPVAITVNAVNDAPVNTVPGAQAVNEDTALAFTGVNTLSVTDVDGNLASTQLTVLNGTVTVTLSGAATISAGLNGSNTLTISGTETDINATLATLVYQGTLNYNGPDTLTVVSADGAGVPLSDTDPVAITVNAVNDAPVNTVPGAQAVNEDTALAFTVGEHHQCHGCRRQPRDRAAHGAQRHRDGDAVGCRDHQRGSQRQQHPHHLGHRDRDQRDLGDLGLPGHLELQRSGHADGDVDRWRGCAAQRHRPGGDHSQRGQRRAGEYRTGRAGR